MLPLTDGVVRLRDWRAEDVEALRPWLEPGRRWQSLDAPYLPRPAAGDVVALLQARVRDRALPTPRRGLVVATAENDVFVGEVGWYWESEPSDWRRLGIVLYDPATWGAGLGTRALRLWTSHLFATTRARRLDFVTWSGNAGMLGVGRRLGFREEARFRDARLVDGRCYDAVVMGVLRSEWPASA